jgi:NADH-quinone oxidoreductase subunit I
MTKTYDYSEVDITNMNYHFTNLSPAEAEEKRKLYEAAQAAKAKPAATLPISNAPSGDTPSPTAAPKPAFKPFAKPIIKKDPNSDANAAS